MAPGNKQKSSKEKESGTAPKTSSKWKTPLVVAMLALGLYRAIEYHNYWNSLSPVVEVKQGQLQGRAAVTDSGTEYFAFQGVPFAAPPVGPLRFRDPQPPPSWAPEVRDVRDDGPVCAQPAIKFPTELPSNISLIDVVRFIGAVPAIVRRAIKLVRQSEDCLQVNIFTPKVPKAGDDAQLLPVMLYFHGGAFVYGDNGVDMLGPQYIMDQGGVVLVTAKYRLGPLGFLALRGAPEGVGNAGLKDAVAALRWVRENIARFGGDPDKVTVAGQSAGGAIAHYLTVAPATKGLLRGAICMSGTALHHWAFSTPETAQHRTRVFVRRLLERGAAGGPDGPAAPDMNNPKDILRFLREVDLRHLVDQENFADLEEESKWLMDEFPFQPTVDGALVPAPPLELIRAGRFHHVPILLGLTAREGLFAFPSADAKNLPIEQQMKILDDNFHFALPEYMREVLPQGSEALKQLEAAVKEAYFGKMDISKGSMQQFLDFYGTLMFDLDAHRTLREVVTLTTAPVFAYNFTFEGRLNLFRRFMIFHRPDFQGATHCDELNYLFHVDILPHIPLENTDPEIKMRKDLVTFFTNFVKSGHPTPTVTQTNMEWPQVTRKDTRVLNINIPTSIQDGYRAPQIKLWSKFFRDMKP